MKLPLQITFRDMPPSEALDAAIREKVEKLDQFFPHIMSCRVTLATIGKHKQQGREFTLGVDITVPGREIVVNRDHHEDFYVALRDAFDDAKRQLEEHARLHRGDVKTHELEEQGEIARLFPAQGYGFIRSADERDIYFAAANVAHPPFERLTPGMKVTYLEESGGEGPQARRVVAL